MEVKEASARYVRATGYKQTEVGVIPEDWAVVSAADACSKIQDGTHFSPRIGGNDYLYVTSKNIRFGCLDLSTAARIDAAQHQAIYRRCDVKKGDLLLTKDGANTGNAAINTLDEEFSLLSSVAFLRFHQSKHCAAYFLQQILTSQGQRQIQDAMAGNAITRLTLEKINKLRFAVPPTKAEQEAIAEALSDADALIESLEHLLVKKRRVKQGAMQELLTGKRRLPGFSGEWEVKRLGDVADTDPENLGSDTRPNFTFNYIALEDVDVGILRSYSEQVFRTAPSRARRKLRKADVLVSTVRPNLMSHLLFPFDGERWVCSTGFCVVRCKEGVSHPGYVYFHLFAGSVTRQIEALLTGSNYPAINSGDVRAFQILFPDYEEQTAIATILSDMDAEIAALEVKLAKARSLKQGMMQELLTGRIRLSFVPDKEEL